MKSLHDEIKCWRRHVMEPQAKIRAFPVSRWWFQCRKPCVWDHVSHAWAVSIVRTT
jgi:hypothetical protein